MAPTLRRSLQTLFDVVFPPRCFQCGGMGIPLCRSCLGDIESFGHPRCPRCDEPASERHRCSIPASIETLSVVGPHTSTLRKGVHSLKYEGNTSAAAPLAALLARRIRRDRIDAIVPVPLGVQRHSDRGYNQAALLADELGRILSIPVHPALLTRIRETRPQVGLTREERRENVANAFEASPAAAGKRWLIVDDVCTTGATLGACADALHAAGAGDVYAATVTRSN